MDLVLVQHLLIFEYGTNKFTLKKAFSAADALNVSANVFLNQKLSNMSKPFDVIRWKNEPFKQTASDHECLRLFGGQTGIINNTIQQR